MKLSEPRKLSKTELQLELKKTRDERLIRLVDFLVWSKKAQNDARNSKIVVG